MSCCVRKKRSNRTSECYGSTEGLVTKAKIEMSLQMAKIGMFLQKAKIGMFLLKAKIGMFLLKAKIGMSLQKAKIGMSFQKAKIGMSFQKAKIGMSLRQKSECPFRRQKSECFKASRNRMRFCGVQIGMFNRGYIGCGVGPYERRTYIRRFLEFPWRSPNQVLTGPCTS